MKMTLLQIGKGVKAIVFLLFFTTFLIVLLAFYFPISVFFQGFPKTWEEFKPVPRKYWEMDCQWL